MARLIDADELKFELQCVIGNRHVLEGLFAEIDAAPTVDAETVRRGRWERKNNARSCSRIGDYEEWHECSVCDASTEKASDYCPWCGARMDEVGE